MLAEKASCDKCQHQDICKWCSDMEKVQTDVNKIPFNKLMSPIGIHVYCDQFQVKL
jgi:hypothetical protein